jgi:hypothetical protein
LGRFRRIEFFFGSFAQPHRMVDSRIAGILHLPGMCKGLVSDVGDEDRLRIEVSPNLLEDLEKQAKWILGCCHDEHDIGAIRLKLLCIGHGLFCCEISFFLKDTVYLGKGAEFTITRAGPQVEGQLGMASALLPVSILDVRLASAIMRYVSGTCSKLFSHNFHKPTSC